METVSTASEPIPENNHYIRVLAATNSPITFVNPKTGKSFWQEYTQAGFNGKIPKLRLKVFGEWVRANPVATFQDLRKYAPVLEMPALPIKDSPYPNKGTIVLSRYRDVVEVLNEPTKFTVRNYNKKMMDAIGPFMLAFDGTQYNLKEKPWMRKMMPKEDQGRVREMIRQLVTKTISDQRFIGQDIKGKYYGRLELVNQVARRVPILLSGEYFGFPGPSLDKMYEWSRASQEDFFHNVAHDDGIFHKGPDFKVVHEAAVKAGHEMHLYLKTLVQQRQAQIQSGENQQDDILTRLVKGGDKEFVSPMSAEDDRIRTAIIGTLVGGVETTQAAIVQSLYQLFLRPDVYEGARQAALQNRVDIVEKYVWEALRFHPVNPFVVRYAEQDYVLKSGAKIPKGYHVMAATQSAMFDDTESGFERPNEFKLDRDQSKFFHLGYGHHRCLGDYVGLVEVPEVVMALLKLPNLRPASGQSGQLDFRKRTKTHMLTADDNSTAFPEHFSVEFDANAADKKAVEVANQQYAYEDYLMVFDRTSYRQCLAGLPLSTNLPTALVMPVVVGKNYEKHKINTITGDNRELLYCRLNGEFRSCMEHDEQTNKFTVLLPSAAHERAFEICSSKTGLTEMEKSFYRHVMLAKELDVTKIDASESVRSTGKEYAFEDHLKFYDRFTYRECIMNPLGLQAFPNASEMLMYARMNIDFRLCMGPPILKHRYSGGLLGTDREETYEKCKNGVYNPATFKYEGRLSKTEKYIYETEVLGRNISYDDVE